MTDKQSKEKGDRTNGRLFTMLKLKRIKNKSDMPDRVKIHCISHVYLNGDKFKIYMGRHEMWLHSTELYLFNLMNGKWYKLINEKPLTCR